MSLGRHLIIFAAGLLLCYAEDNGIFGVQFSKMIASWPSISNQMATASSCDKSKLTSCTNSVVLTALGVKKIPSSSDLGNDILTELGSKSGFEGLCKTTNSYVKCMGLNFDKCMTVANLKSMGYDNTSSIEYALEAQLLEYLCGEGYAVADASYACVLNDITKKGKQMGDCATNFAKSVKADPSKFCQYFNTFVNCEANVFADCGRDAAAEICQLLKVTFETASGQSSQCQIKCSSLIPNGSSISLVDRKVIFILFSILAKVFSNFY